MHWHDEADPMDHSEGNESESSEVLMEESSVDKPSSSSGLSEEQRRAISDPRFRWYIVNTYTGSEETVKLALRERIERSKLKDCFGEIFVPKMMVEKVLKSGKKKLVDKTVYPGYLMIQMQLNDDSQGCVTATPKVTGFVGDKRKPRPMSDKDVLRLLNQDASETLMEEKEVSQYKKGEAVKVTDGPFTNFDGVIEEVRPEKKKVKVLVSIFGRETPVELDFVQIKKL